MSTPIAFLKESIDPSLPLGFFLQANNPDGLALINREESVMAKARALLSKNIYDILPIEQIKKIAKVAGEDWCKIKNLSTKCGFYA